jgi:hypothetical protein
LNAQSESATQKNNLCYFKQNKRPADERNTKEGEFMYRTIDSAFWTDAKIKKLNIQARYLLLYLITNPHAHVGGIYYIPRVLILHETGLKDRVLDTLYDTLSGAGLARFDTKNEVIWVVNMAKYQMRGEKTERATAGLLKSLHKSPLVKEFLKKYPSVTKWCGDTLSYTLSDTLSEVGTQEQEQEKEQEQNNNPSPNEEQPPPEPCEIPEPLNTPEFQEAWQAWEKYRKETRHTLTPSTRARQLNMLSKKDVATAILMLNQSIQNGWQGIFEVNNGNSTTNRGNSGTPKIAPAQPGQFKKPDLIVQ